MSRVQLFLIEQTQLCRSCIKDVIPDGLVPLRIVVLVAVQLVWVVRGHVGEVLEDVLVGFIS